MEKGIAIMLLFWIAFIAVMLTGVVFVLYEITKTLQKNGESLSKIEQHLGDTEEKVKVDKQTQLVVTDNVDDSA